VCLDMLSDMQRPSSQILLNPIVVVLAIAVIVLTIIVVGLLLMRRRRDYLICRAEDAVAAPLGIKITTADLMGDYPADTPPQYSENYHCHANSSTVDSLMFDSSTNPCSPSTASTKISSTDGSLNLNGRSVSNDKLGTLPHVIVCCATDAGGLVNSYDDNNDIDDNKFRCYPSSSTASSDDMKDEVSVASALLDSDVDARFLSSKRLIEKKERNRRSAGDELEQTHRLLTKLRSVPQDARIGSGSPNRRSW